MIDVIKMHPGYATLWLFIIAAVLEQLVVNLINWRRK
jgi:hypothetical protein